MSHVPRKKFKLLKRWANVGNLHIHPLEGFVEIYDTQDEFMERVYVKDLDLFNVYYYTSFIGSLQSRTTCAVSFKEPTTILLYEEGYICTEGKW